jgi:hypothetical protein
MSDTKICINCTFYQQQNFHCGPTIHKCKHSSATKINLVTGKNIYINCDDMRKDNIYKFGCGKEGLLFIQKEKN